MCSSAWKAGETKDTREIKKTREEIDFERLERLKDTPL